MISWRTLLKFIAKCLLYSFVIILIDFVILFSLAGRLEEITYSLSIVMLLEGGIGLVVGGGAVLYSPVSAKISEMILHTKPWNAKRQKEVETQTRAWIITGVFLVLEALLLSALCIFKCYNILDNVRKVNHLLLEDRIRIKSHGNK